MGNFILYMAFSKELFDKLPKSKQIATNMAVHSFTKAGFGWLVLSWSTIAALGKPSLLLVWTGWE